MNTSRLRWATATGAGLLLAFAACTLVLDRSPVQCNSDSDCAAFGTHPFCRSNVCVPSGLGPTQCFYGTPQSDDQFFNQCGTAECSSFDSCAHKICDGNPVDAGLMAIPRPDAAVPSGANEAGAPDGGADGGSIEAGTVDAGALSDLPKCFDPSEGRSQVVYITGSSNFPPLLSQLALLLAEPAAGGYTPIYRITSSCDGVRSMLSDKESDHRLRDPAPGPTANYATYFTPSGAAVMCTLGPDGAQIDVGESDIFSSTCSGFAEPTGVVEHVLGPILAMAFVVPGSSTQRSITAEAAFSVFGRGGKNASGDAVSPWDTPSYYYVRNANTGTQQMIGRAINVPADKFWGIDRGTAKRVAETLPILDPSLAEKAIGIISIDFYDLNRVGLKALAFAAFGQSCAYLPDSSPYSFDKRNVRDGHYPIWGPLHFFAAASNGVPTSAAALAFLNVVSGNVVMGDVPNKLLDAYIGASMVPPCAMSVQRNAELGPMTAYAPRGMCGCYFEKKATGKVPSGCAVCETSEDCSDPKRPFCSHGFCEVQ